MQLNIKRTSTTGTTDRLQQPIKPPPRFLNTLSTINRHTKLRAGSGILTIVIILSLLISTLGLATVQLTSANFSNLETSGIALKAQQLAKVKALQADVTLYSDADTLAETRQLIAPTNLYRETIISPETLKPNGTKERTISIKVYNTSTTNKPIFELNTIVTNKADQVIEPSTQIVSSNGNTSVSAVANANYQKATFIITTKFGANPDGASNRYATYAIHLVDGVKEYPGSNIYNGKSGNNGHYWGFEGYGHINLTYNYNIPKGSTVSAWLHAQSYHQRSDITIILSKN